MDGNLNISNFISDQFPEIYQSEAKPFVAFVTEYFKFLESNNQTINVNRLLLQNRDIDNTVDSFLIHFKNTYLQNLPLNTKVDTKFLVKHIKDLYTSKGSSRSFKLLFRLLFDEEIQVKYPSESLFKASESDYYKPQYIETSYTDKVLTFQGKEIVGSSSNSKAFVESISTRLIKGKEIIVLTLSNVRGLFLLNELVTSDGDATDCPVITGSLTSIDLTNGGQDFNIGDTFDVVSSEGKGGRARVTAIENATGRIIFELASLTFATTAIDGGSGYTLTDSSNTGVSAATVEYNNLTNSDSNITDFFRFETIRQPNQTVTYLNGVDISDNIEVGGYINGANSTGGIIANGIVASTSLDGANGSLVIIVNTGNFNDSSDLYLGGAPTVNAIIDTTTNTHITGNLVNSNTTYLGIAANNLAYYITNNAFVIGDSSNSIADIISAGTGQGADFNIGTISNTETISLYTDFINDINIANQAYLDVKLDASNSGIGFLESIVVNDGGAGYNNSDTISFSGGSATTNAAANVQTYTNGTINTITVTIPGGGYYSNGVSSITTSGGVGANINPNFDYGYGFPKDRHGDLNTILDNMLSSNTFTIGSINSLSGINPGENYNLAPFSFAFNPYIAGFNRRDLVLEINNVSGGFIVGESITQAIQQSGISMNILDLNGSFTTGEGVTQTSSNATGVISYANSTIINIANTSGVFTSVDAITGFSSNATANVSSNTSINNIFNAKGIVKSANGTHIIMKRTSFNTSFEDSFSITGVDSSATADILSVIDDGNSRRMGDNAVIGTTASTANGVATKVEVIDSGFGYINNGDVTLSGNSDFVITGTSNVLYYGVGTGRWRTRQSFLSDNAKLHDNFYYQELSYVIQSGLSLDKYSKVLKDILHVSGTKLFGEVIKVQEAVGLQLSISNSSVTIG